MKINESDRQLELHNALDSAYSTNESWENGLKAYEEAIKNGESHELALKIAISVTNFDSKQVVETEVTPAHHSKWRWVARAILLALLVLIIGFGFRLWGSPSVTTNEVTPTPTPTLASTKDAMAKANQILQKSGWKEKDYVLKAVDKSKDKSTPGQGSFTQKGIKTPDEMITFLGSKTKGAVSLLNKIKKDTGASEKTILSSPNWIAVQSNIPFKYPGNTGYKNGMIVALGTRSGNANDIFMLFASPIGKVIAVRGACANPQVVIPVPVIPTPTPTPRSTPTPKITPTPRPTPTLTPKPILTPTPTPKPTLVPTLKPKSSDPKDYKKPGDDLKKDSGIGTKPLIPIVTTPPESTPPPVVIITQTKNGGSIVDTATNKPGSETGVTAPGVVPTPISTPAPVATPTPTPIPSPELGVNPANGVSKNDTDPGNPFK